MCGDKLKPLLASDSLALRVGEHVCGGVRSLDTVCLRRRQARQSYAEILLKKIVTYISESWQRRPLEDLAFQPGCCMEVETAEATARVSLYSTIVTLAEVENPHAGLPTGVSVLPDVFRSNGSGCVGGPRHTHPHKHTLGAEIYKT